VLGGGGGVVGGEGWGREDGGWGVAGGRLVLVGGLGWFCVALGGCRVNLVWW